MQNNIGVGVAIETLVVWDFYTAEDKLTPLRKTVNIKTKTNARMNTLPDLKVSKFWQKVSSFFVIIG